MTSLDRIIDSYGASLSRIAASYEADRALQEDLLQEMLIAIHRALPRLREQDRLAPFVFRIAHNRAATHVSRQVRRKEGERGGVEDRHVNATPEAIALSGERSQLVGTAIRSLPLPYRQVMTLLLEEMSYAEIADTLQISVSNVGVRVNRAKALLKERLHE
jgi:RNA polymerase sigma-70 factor (ECF subfamily)